MSQDNSHQESDLEGLGSISNFLIICGIGLIISGLLAYFFDDLIAPSITEDFIIAEQQKLQQGDQKGVIGQTPDAIWNDVYGLESINHYLEEESEPAAVAQASTTQQPRTAEFYWTQDIMAEDKAEQTRLALLLEGHKVKRIQVIGGYALKLGPFATKSQRNNAKLAMRKLDLTPVLQPPTRVDR